MSLSTQNYKGTRDFYPEDMRFRRWMFSKWTEVVESFGYELYDAPLIEPTEIYAAKTGDEIVNEQSYRFEDRGGRDVMIRPEMTPTVSRMVAARRQELPYPLRWYSIDNFMRYERPQRGRLREFWQLNVDIFGVRTIDADVELIQIADQIMKSVGASNEMYSIKINSRRLIALIMADYLQLDTNAVRKMTKLFDKKDKMSDADFSGAAAEVVGSGETLDRVNKLVNAGSMADLPEQILESQPVKEVQILFTLLGDLGITNAQFDVSLMRGLDYYTDIVFEVYDSSEDNSRSIFGGGRYDGLVGQYGVESLSTAGFAIGDIAFENFMTTHELLPELGPETDLYVIPVGDILRQAQGVVTLLRSEGLNVAIDITGRKLDKQIGSAVKKGIRYALFVGEQELDEEYFTLRDLESSKEEKLSIERIIAKLASDKS